MIPVTIALGIAAQTAVGQTSFTATVQGSSVLLQWPAQSGAVSYRVERTAAGLAPAELTTTTNNVGDAAGLAAFYNYQLFARSSNGSETLAASIYDFAPNVVSDRDIAAFVAAHLNSPQVIADAMARTGVTPLRLSQATGYSLTDIANYFAAAGMSASAWNGTTTPPSNNAGGTTTPPSNYGGGTNVTSFSARDQGNGEILLEWPAQPSAVSYRVQRTASGLPTVSFDAGSHSNAMDIAGLAGSYTYQVFMTDANGAETTLGTLQYTAPAYVMQAVAAATGRIPQLRSALGTNLEGVTYYSSELPFVDVMKSSSEWISGDSSTWDNGQALDVDANGWVRSLANGQIARKLMMRDINGQYPGGQYLVRYKGEGTLNFSYAASVVAQQPGAMLIQVNPTNDGIYMEITATNPANYLRDIEVIMPGGICEGNFTAVATSAADCGGQRFLAFADYPKSILFYPVFLERLRSYSVLRFMDWMATNGSNVTGWTQRTPFSYHTWAAANGVPAEVMVALANRVGAHPWFNIPHQSDDNYAQLFAQGIQARLAPNLGVYVEYSNEVWNAMFAQYNYAMSQGAAQGLDNMQYYALRADNIGRIFKSVLGSPRVVSLLGGQYVNTWTATHGLDYLKSRYGNTGAIDAIDIAPYFAVMPDTNQAAQFDAMSLDQFFSYVSSTVIPDTARYMQQYSGAAASYGLRLVSYEGGQHMVGILNAVNDNALCGLFDAFNRDWRIRDLYLTYLNDWKQAAGQLFVHFNDVGTYSKWGRWGALEYIAQPRSSSPKFDAIETFIEQNPVWWKQ